MSHMGTMQAVRQFSRKSRAAFLPSIRLQKNLDRKKAWHPRASVPAARRVVSIASRTHAVCRAMASQSLNTMIQNSVNWSSRHLVYAFGLE